MARRRMRGGGCVGDKMEDTTSVVAMMLAMRRSMRRRWGADEEVLVAKTRMQ